MKNILLLILISIFWINGNSQHTLKITGNNMKINGSTSLVLTNTQFVNNGTFDAATGTVIIKGNATASQSAIGGTSMTTFYNLKIDKTTNGSQIDQNIQVDNNLDMTAGNLNLNGQTLTLETTNGQIINESPTSYITDIAGGVVQKTMDLNNPSSINPGNIGATITSAANLGTTVIQRGHIAQHVDGADGIYRYYNITPTNNTGLAATLRMTYMDHELNNIAETDLEPFRNNGSSWEYYEVSTADVTNNYVETTNINEFSTWTLAQGNIKLMPKIMLQGAYVGGQMNDNLRSQSLIPTTEPFSALGFTHVGGGSETVAPAVFNTTGNNAIMDWVFLELRDKNNPSTVIRTRSALLQKDGDIVDLNGMAPASFPVVNADDYFVAIRHRNHLGIRSASTIALALTTNTYDFTSALTQAYKNPLISSNEAMVDIGSGVYGMFRADVNNNNIVNVVDFLLARSNSVPNQVSVYKGADVNMDGNINVVDFLITKAQSLPNKVAHF